MSRFDKFHVHDLMIGVYLHGRAWVTILRHPGLNHPKNASGDSLRKKFKYMLERNPDLIHFTPEHRNEEVARDMLIMEAENLGRLNRLLELIGNNGDGAGEGDLHMLEKSIKSQAELWNKVSEGMIEIMNKITILKCMVETVETKMNAEEEEENLMD
ncbi:uncharacterized protein LOC131647285 [Vicia villosa]|uniref:uncharacterized protein LOC131647285 n=1 Tax=Vicia villosa TaxID=3911 RepID=UPI00273AA9C0|nr:uncharacterized protein LOC131647285 [Vicia villosa]